MSLVSQQLRRSELESYWSRFLSNRTKRRRVLAATAATGLGAAFLAACGGGDGGSEGSKDQTSLIFKPEDSLKQAKRGGILKDRANGDAPSFSVQDPIAPLNYPAKDVY